MSVEETNEVAANLGQRLSLQEDTTPVSVDLRTTSNETIIYSKLGNKKVKCGICKHECIIQENAAGTCGTRWNTDGKLMSLVYGEVTGLANDPIEKKPLYHHLPGSMIISVGSVGCNFKCAFCQNWQSSQHIQAVKKKDKSIDLRLMLHEIEDMCSTVITPEQLIQQCIRMRSPSVAFTYNEPTTFFEFTYDTAKLAKEKGIHTVYVTNGFMSEKAIELLAPYLDSANVDLKSFNAKWYRKVCGGSLDGVCCTIRSLYEAGVHIEITTLVIENENDSNEELRNICNFIASIDPAIPWHISAAHPDHEMKNTMAFTRYETLTRAYNIGAECGLKHIYEGNVCKSQHQNTLCPKCGTLLIQRANYGRSNKIMPDMDVTSGVCKKCHTAIRGVWK